MKKTLQPRSKQSGLHFIAKTYFMQNVQDTLFYKWFDEVWYQTLPQLGFTKSKNMGATLRSCS